MVRLDLQVVGLQLELHMPVAEVIGRAQQVEGRAVFDAGAHHHHRLRRGDHLDQRAVLGHQHVAAAHHLAARQEDAERRPCESSASKRLFCACPSRARRGGALEQHAAQALACGISLLTVSIGVDDSGSAAGSAPQHAVDGGDVAQHAGAIGLSTSTSV
jgi:hypothetical protein